MLFPQTTGIAWQLQSHVFQLPTFGGSQASPGSFWWFPQVGK
jgi:hypothetical protein